jgi:syndecan 1
VDAGRCDAPLGRLAPSSCDDFSVADEVDGVTPSGAPATPAGRSDEPVSVRPFNVVLRGYDPRQVDEHLSRLHHRFNVLRRRLDSARSQVVRASPGVPGARPHPTLHPGPEDLPTGGDRPDVVGAFIDRLQAIVRAAEKEAGEIRGKAQAAARAAVRAEEERAAAARAAARAAEETVRTSLAELVRQRDAALADLARARGQVEALRSGPSTRSTPPIQQTGSDTVPNTQDLPDPTRST